MDVASRHLLRCPDLWRSPCSHCVGVVQNGAQSQRRCGCQFHGLIKFRLMEGVMEADHEMIARPRTFCRASGSLHELLSPALPCPCTDAQKDASRAGEVPIWRREFWRSARPTPDISGCCATW